MFDAAKHRLVCPNCRSEDSGESVESGKMTQCVMCGAELEVKDFASALRCGHCRTWQILTERTSGDYEPHLVIPFCVGKEQAEEILRKEFKTRLFTPGSFLSGSSLEELQGSYVPFWLYDYDSECDFEAVGTKVRTWRSGNTEYTETSRYRVVRDLSINFERIPADASFVMEDGIMDLMEPYEYKELTQFEPMYLSGFFSEVYNDKPEVFEPRAKDKARGASEECLQSTIGGYVTLSPVKKEFNIRLKGTKYALFPVWIYRYRYQGKEYPFYVNGQTGKVVGKSPVSIGSIAAVGISFFVSAAATAGVLLHFLEVL